MTHAIIYDRASTMSQKDNFSRVNAKEYGIKIAEQNGFTCEYVKEIGSGTTLTGRPEMMKILDRIAAGEVQALIVQELDRLARPEEPVIYSTIRNTVMDYNVIIYTHTSRIDLNNDDDDFVADITMSVAKKERRRMLKRSKRGRKTRAENGKFPGGISGLGYTIVGSGSTSDFQIDPKSAKLVRLIFNILEQEGGNLWGTAKRLNALGYTGVMGKPFKSNSVKVIATRKLYIGIFESKATDKVTHRPDLQIVPIDQFNRVQDMLRSRSTGANLRKGSKGRYILTGFVTCGCCGGPMVAANHNKGILYQCYNYRLHGKAVCKKPKTYSERLILPPVVELLTNLVQSHIDLRAAMREAAAQYGKSVIEEAHEARVNGELASVRAGMKRLVDGVAVGVFKTENIAESMAELRGREQDLIAEVARLTKKTALAEDWQDALDSLEGRTRNETITRLSFLAKNNPVGFRQFLSLVFQPNSLKVSTKRVKGRKWGGAIDDYQITEDILELQEKIRKEIEKSTSFDNTPPNRLELLLALQQDQNQVH